MAKGLRAITGGLLMALAGLAAHAETPVPGDPVASETGLALTRPLAAPRWTADAARDLLRAITDADKEGLRPADYRPAALRRAIDAGEGTPLDAAADAAARALAHDYLAGRVADRAAFDWHIAADPYALAALPDQIDTALGERRVGDFLRSLLPADDRYRALRAALAESSDPAERAAIRANMERARWMPRRLAASYLYVNVPSYRLQVVDNDVAGSSYTVVVGARETPTPMLASDTSSLVVNPWWNVPQSIVRSANLRPGRAGYVFKAAVGGWQVRQPPGPKNALGRIKFNLDNDQAIYLHDTPAKAGFRRDARALSHGCIRVQDIDQLAAELVEDGTHSARLEAALSDSATTSLRLARRWTVYLVYFTRDVDASGALVHYGDPYARDAALAMALDGGAMQIASN